MHIDHRTPRAAYARLISRLDHLHKALDRAAGQPGLGDAATSLDAGERLARLADELAALTGTDPTPLLARTPAGLGQQFLASAELLGLARAADWWHEEATRVPDELDVPASSYL